MSLSDYFKSWFLGIPAPQPTLITQEPAPATPIIKCGLMLPEFGFNAYQELPPGEHEFIVPATAGYMEGATVTFLANSVPGVPVSATFEVTQCDFLINGRWESVMYSARNYTNQGSHVAFPFTPPKTEGQRVGVLLSDEYNGPARDRKATKFRFKGKISVSLV